MTLEARLGGDIITRLRNILVAVNMLEPGQCTHTNNEMKKFSFQITSNIAHHLEHCQRNWLNTTSGADPAISKGEGGGGGVQYILAIFKGGPIHDLLF